MAEVAPKYKTFGPRLKAGIIDNLVLFPLSLLEIPLLDAERPAVLIIVWAAISYSAAWVYYVLLHARRGATVGKKAMSIRVLDISEARYPTMRQALLRESPHIAITVLALILLIAAVANGTYGDERVGLSDPEWIVGMAATAWLVLELVTMFTNDKRRALHDLLAGTVVVREPRPVPPVAR